MDAGEGGCGVDAVVEDAGEVVWSRSRVGEDVLVDFVDGAYFRLDSECVTDNGRKMQFGKEKKRKESCKSIHIVYFDILFCKGD